jgi:pimeloyl-ACP methyl ester carboxylesterase
VLVVSEPFWFAPGRGVVLAGERWSGSGARIVLLHAGVADRRSWHEVAARLAPEFDLVAYDRRGFGDSPPSADEFRHVDDLLAVIDEAGDAPAWLVGSSMGGALAIDAALAAPDRVAGLVLLAPAVSGEPDDQDIDADTQRLIDLLDAADGDPAATNRWETSLWLDGPAAAEGRVSGPARDLALDMNRIVLAHEVPEGAGDSGLDAWSDLERITAPTTVACGDLDVPAFRARSEQIAQRIPAARFVLLTGVAHLPYLEQPDTIGALIAAAVRGGS